MKNIEINIIPPEEIITALPLLKLLNDFTPTDVLKSRLIEMSTLNYKCVGVYADQKLVGISGLWFLTRHYSGKTIEPDHVIIDPEYREHGLGKKLFKWIHQYAQNIGYEATELNTYISNTRSHSFYEQMDYKKLGFHYLKIL